ncbi:MAG: hypothetical protein OSB69_22175 [Alphaproteobacteria bacterium]|nr:hypothetical protein [Alphaproteobacteria bacterium]
MTDSSTVGEFCRFVGLDNLGQKDLSIGMTASAEERDALARRFLITDIPSLEAKLKISRKAEGVFEVVGTLDADIVFMAEDVMNFTVSESVVEVFATEVGWENLRENSIEGEVDAELIKGDRIDVGEVVAQNLSLALDPVLLKIGSLDEGAVTYAAKGRHVEVPSNHPFAGLVAHRQNREQRDDSSND